MGAELSFGLPFDKPKLPPTEAWEVFALQSLELFAVANHVSPSLFPILLSIKIGRHLNKHLLKLVVIPLCAPEHYTVLAANTHAQHSSVFIHPPTIHR